MRDLSLWCMGLVDLWHVGSLTSPTRDQIHVSCIARQILNDWTTREVPVFPYLDWALNLTSGGSLPFGDLLGHRIWVDFKIERVNSCVG